MARAEINGLKRLHARVRGTVQGVGFRAFVHCEARRLGLSGWVRNCPDGSVEVLAEGPNERLTQLLALLRRGPRAAAVDDVQADWSDAAGGLSPFSVRY